ncbi:hypothetical protein D3C87_111600 [compost metagenome]
MGGFLLLLTACGVPLEGSDLSSRGPASAEPAYYGKPTDYSGTNPIRVKALAKFRYRALNFTFGDSANGLSTTIASENIAHAEYHIYNSSGVRVQQGETAEDGVLLFDIPRTAGTYTIKVFSRAANEYINVSILEDIYNNQPYSISGNFTINLVDANNNSFGTALSPYDTSVTPILAEASEYSSAKVEGGAFNIMHMIYLANRYIRETINKNDDTAFTDKNKWWVADKVSIYWKAGFNPYSYVYSSTSTLLSYYSPGQSKLYILGGKNGNVKTADTDHFDNSVILHEYGHFLEDRYAFSSSPGGSHNGDFVIDPRLAWSEGWANYFQAAVRSHFDASTSAEGDVPTTTANYYYIDTFGYKSSGADSTAGVSIAFNLNQDANSAPLDQVTPMTTSGEGIFREVSIARTLYKITRGVTQPYAMTKFGGGIAFADLWKSFAGEDTAGHRRETSILANSLRNPTYLLPNAGLFNKFVYANSAATKTNMLLILDEEKSLRDESEYGARVTAQVSACTREVKGTFEDTLVYPRSNPLRNNDFFIYNHPGGGANLDLLYEKTDDCDNASCTMDLDLILYKIDAVTPYIYYEDYWIYNDDSAKTARSYSRIVRESRRSPAAESTSGGFKMESISWSGISAGTYMINVKLNAYGKANSLVDGTVEYNLKIGSSYLCP